MSRNGLVNPHMHVRLPSDGRPDLSRYRRELWRMDAESTDGAMSLALGIVQAWSERNADKRFLTIASHHVRPSDQMLAWAAALGNLWVGTTLSAWFHPSEGDVRLESLARLLRFGVPSVAFVVTRPAWDNRPAADAALRLLPPDRVIEVPYRTGVARQALPLLDVNPLGACSDHRVGPLHRPYHIVCEPTPDGSGRRSRLVDRDGRGTTARTHSRCDGCRLQCGVHVLDAPPDRP